MRQGLQNVVLVCPDNDAESRMILLLAYELCSRLGMVIIRSSQAHGATLDREPGGIVDLIHATGKHEVWIVEIPGVQIEEALDHNGMEVVIIDHHTYGELDRSKDADGQMLPSSLHQFLKLADIRPHELTRNGFKPRLVRGVGILDARFAQGLRAEGYSLEEIREVLDFRRDHAMAGNPDFKKAQEAARGSWENRQHLDEYTIVRSNTDISIRGAVSTITIYEDCDTQPLIVEEYEATEIFVQNVDPSVVSLLKSAIPEGFTFGEGRCWGVNNKRSGTTYTLDHILGVLS